jgi:hypothetical protein
MSRTRILARFWWDFVVGDDWRLALGLLLAVGATLLLHHSGIPAWWLLPGTIALLLPRSLQRAVRQRAVTDHDSTRRDVPVAPQGRRV